MATGVPGLDNLIRPGATSGDNLIPSRRRRQGPPNPTPAQTVSVPPGESDTRQFTGVLREIDRNVNHMKGFGYDDDGPMAIAMAKAILGNRWASEFGRITVHTTRVDNNQIESYTAWLPASRIKDRRIRRGVTVSVKLTSVDVSERYRDWYCDDFQVVG